MRMMKIAGCLAAIAIGMIFYWTRMAFLPAKKRSSTADASGEPRRLDRSENRGKMAAPQTATCIVLSRSTVV